MQRRFETFVLVLTLFALGAAAQAGFGTTIEKHDGVTRYRWTTALASLSAELGGQVEFTADDTDVARLSPGGYLEIATRDGLSRREVKIRRGDDGALEYAYRRGGEPAPFDDEARAWLAGVLPRLIRESAIGAEARVARILAAQGVGGVLQEIDRIESSQATRIYCTELLRQGELDDAELRRLARAAADGIASSGDRAAFLIVAADRYLPAGGAVEAYFDATRTIPSSGDHARVLLHAIDEGLVDDPAALAALLRSAREIASSGDKARVLAAAARVYTEDDRVRTAFFEAADGIPSSGDHARVLLELLDRRSLAAESLAALYASARGIASSGDKARVLEAGAPQFANEPAVRRSYFRSADSIASSGDHARALLAVLEHGAPDAAGLIALLASARGIASSQDKTRVLVAAADRARDDAVVEAYIETAETVASSGDRKRALAALIR